MPINKSKRNPSRAGRRIATVFCEGNKVSLVGDLVAGHKIPRSRLLVQVPVFATGKSVNREGDAPSCGHVPNGASICWLISIIPDKYVLCLLFNFDDYINH